VIDRPAAFALGLLLPAFCAACSGGAEEGARPGAQGESFPNRRPKFPLPAGDVGVTSDNGSDTLTVLDLEAFEALGAAPVGRDPVDRDGPHHVAIDRAAGIVFTALAYPAPAVAPGPHAAHGSAARAGYVQKLALDDLRPLGEVRVEQNPGDIVLSEDGTRLVVSHFDLRRALENDELEARRATLALLDPAAVTSASSAAPLLVTTCVAPHGVALSRPSGERAFVACYGEDAVAVVDTTDPAAPPELVSVGPGGSPGRPLYGPYAAVLSNDGSLLAVSNTVSADVRLFATAERSFRESVLTPSGTPYFAAWAAGDSVLYVPTQNPDGIEAFDVASGERLRRRSFEQDECELPHEVVFGSDPSRLFVVCEGDHAAPSVVLALEPEAFTTLGTLSVGVFPDRLAVGRRAE
jgi:DNA-binding beta-propeller fold protein YncE